LGSAPRKDEDTRAWPPSSIGCVQDEEERRSDPATVIGDSTFKREGGEAGLGSPRLQETTTIRSMQGRSRWFRTRATWTLQSILTGGSSCGPVSCGENGLDARHQLVRLDGF